MASSVVPLIRRTDGKRPTALVTGASNGIGLEIARQLAQSGHDLVLVARSTGKLRVIADELARAHDIAAHPLTDDLSDPAAPARIAAAVIALGLEVDVLVNNAGYGLQGRFLDTDGRMELDMIAVNVSALTHLTKLFLPGMIARRRGRVLNVSSTAAFQPGPRMAVYYATKAYVLSFSEAIAAEVRRSGVTVTCLCPGATHTGFAAGANAERSRVFNGPGVLDAADVARAGIAGMRLGKRVVIPGARNRVLAFATRLVPRKLAARAAAAANAQG